ncbi:MAG: glycosyltransferase family 2 protein [Mucilaginibacter sp.]
MSPKVLIIIPCYNEEASLPHVLKQLALAKLPSAYEMKVIVVNDCSTDNTKAAAKKHNITVLDLPVNLGIGGAVQTGIKYAQKHNFDLAIQLDGDGQHPPAEIIKLINAYERLSSNVIIGSRFIDKQGFQSSLMRRVGIRYFYWLNRIFIGKAIFDSTSGFRLLDKKAIQIAAKNYPDEYPEPQSIVMFSKLGLTVNEVPVIMSHRLGGQSSISATASLYYCIKVTIAMLFSFIRKS